MILTVKGFGIVNKAEIDVFLELSCFFDDPADVGDLAFSKTSLNIWKFAVHVLLKPNHTIALISQASKVMQLHNLIQIHLMCILFMDKNIISTNILKLNISHKFYIHQINLGAFMRKSYKYNCCLFYLGGVLCIPPRNCCCKSRTFQFFASIKTEGKPHRLTN